jgi:DNA repair exonuclease SbcCD nuclease subunit
VRVVIVADPHVGADLWGTAPEAWDAPFLEACRWARENKADLLIVAGDLFHHRSPTPDEYLRASEALAAAFPTQVLVIPGNHDMPAVDSYDATNVIKSLRPEALVALPAIHTIATRGLQVLALPWPRLTDYLTDEEAAQLDLEGQIAAARTKVLADLREEAAALDPTRPAILVGHAMVAYSGGASPDDPGLMLGKDIVLPYDDLVALPNIGGVFLGHVHDPRAKGYVGSTQPTDLGDGDHRKSFLVLDVESALTRIPYATSLRVADLKVEIGHEMSLDTTINGAVLKACERADIVPFGGFDVMRVTVNCAADVTVDPNEVRKIVQAYTKKLVGVEVVREATVARRVGRDEPAIAAMDPRVAFRRWLDTKDDVEADQLTARFDELVTAEA